MNNKNGWSKEKLIQQTFYKLIFSLDARNSAIGNGHLRNDWLIFFEIVKRLSKYLHFVFEEC